MPQGDKWFDFTDLRGGRNGGDTPLSIDPDQVNEALNIDYDDGQLGQKRGGATSLSLTFSAGGPFGSSILSLLNHTPTTPTSQELWAVDGTGLFGRLAAAVTWVVVSLKDAIQDNFHRVTGKSFNSKFFLGYNSAQNRTTLWDGAQHRRAGLGCPTAPPTASVAGGAVTDTRKYWTSVIRKTGTVIDMRSELNETPLSQALAAQQATVSLGGAPGEVETHWELWGASALNGFLTQHYLGEALIGNTIVDNNSALTGVAPAKIGTYLTIPSCKFQLSDGDRMIFAEAWESSASFGQPIVKSGRAWWTPRLGDLDISDDERIIITAASDTAPAIKSYVDIGVECTGLGGQVQGISYMFSYDRIWSLTPTGNINAPYRRLPLGVPFGCIFDKSIVLAEDEHGQAALYFASERGICRIDSQGFVWCGWDVQDIWDGINLAATVPCHAVFHKDKHQVWFDIATGSSSYPDTRLVFDTMLGYRDEVKGVVHGWVKHIGDSCSAICSAMFSTTPGATPSRNKSPYIGRSTGTSVLKCDTSDLDDAGTPFQAYIEKAVAPPTKANQRLGPSYILAKAFGGLVTSLRLTLTADFGKQQAKTSDVTLTPQGAETKVWKQFEDSWLAGVEHSAILRLGDSAAVAAGKWAIDQWLMGQDDEASL